MSSTSNKNAPIGAEWVAKRGHVELHIARENKYSWRWWIFGDRLDGFRTTDWGASYKQCYQEIYHLTYDKKTKTVARFRRVK